MGQTAHPFRCRNCVFRAMLALLGSCIVWVVIADDRGPVIPQGKGEQCVAETDFMRRDHMRLLIHQRDETVLKGIREEPFSLAECVDCHIQTSNSGEPIRIDAEGQFCQSCHDFAAVKIDCFGCHAAVPDQAALGDSDLHPVAKAGQSEPHLGKLTSGYSTLTSTNSLALYQYGKLRTNVFQD